MIRKKTKSLSVIALCLIALLSQIALTTIATVSGNKMTLEADATGTTLASAAFTNNITTNDLVYVGCSWASPSVTDATVTDSAGNTYSRVEGPTYDAGGGAALTTYYTVISTGGGTKPTVTCSFWTTTAHSVASSQPYRIVSVAEFSGTATSSPLDQHGNRSQTSLNSTTDDIKTPSATVTPTQDNELIIAFGAQTNGSAWNTALTAGTGYTELNRALTVSPANYPYQMEYKVQTTATAVQALWTIATPGGSDNWLSNMATFKASGGAGITLVQRRTNSPRTGTRSIQ